MRRLIRGGDVLDGTGAPRRRADVLIEDDRIAAVGPGLPAEADETVDATGLCVAPGFIDIHTHWDLARRTYPDAFSLLHQGVTTVVTGNCGASLAPVAHGRRDALRATLRDFVPGELEFGTWQTFGEYLQAVDAERLGVNMAPLVGHNAVRIAVMGADDRPPSPDDLRAEEYLVDEALASGAFGLSFGLVYLPGVFAVRGQLAAGARAAARHGRLVAVHMRNEHDRLLEALDEMLDVARASGAFLEVSHLKAMGRDNWGRVADALARLEASRRAGVRVGCDVYPYTATGTTVLSLVPPAFLADGVAAFVAALASDAARDRVAAAMDRPDEKGRRPRSLVLGYENVVVARLDHRPEAAGRSLAQLAAEDGRAPAQEVLHLIRTEGRGFPVVNHAMSDRDVTAVLRHPDAVVGSDAVGIAPHHQGRPHPRNYGTFPRVLGRYVRERLVLTWEEAVARMAGRPAERLGLRDRGTLAPGKAADVVILDPAVVADTATFQDPHRLPLGIPFVYVNGTPAVQGGCRTDAFAGRLLRV
jgi:N-acyl-D-amino-acid deacylase